MMYTKMLRAVDDDPTSILPADIREFLLEYSTCRFAAKVDSTKKFASLQGQNSRAKASIKVPMSYVALTRLCLVNKERPRRAHHCV